MSPSPRLLLTLVVIAVTTVATPAQTTQPPPAVKAIRFGTLLDGTGAVLTNAVVIIEGDRTKIVSVSNSSIPANVEVIDLSRYTGIPGMIDMHTHLTGNSEEDLRGQTTVFLRFRIKC